MRVSAVHNVFGTKAYLLWEFRKKFTVFFGFFFVFVSFTLETVICDEQECQFVKAIYCRNITGRNPGKISYFYHIFFFFNISY